MPLSYPYTDAAGTVRYRVVRTADKRFRMEHPGPEGGWELGMGGAERVLYRLPEVMSAAAGSLVFVVEQETDPKSGGLRTVLRDAGVADKRLLLIESEFSGTLKVMARRENTLSDVIRQAWDGKNLHTLTKGDTQRATGAHVSIVGHIVRDELRRHLHETETNGFGNRFLWVCTRRSKKLSRGGSVPEMEALVERLRAAVAAARQMGPVEWSEMTIPLWDAAYDVLTEGLPGLIGAVTGRAEAQVLRLATLYAVLDGRAERDVDHLLAALAVWDYCEASAKYLFARGERLEQRLLELLEQAPRGLTRAELREHLGNHVPADRIDRALASFAAADLVSCEKRTGTGGRPAELCRIRPAAKTEAREKTEETEESPEPSPPPAEPEKSAEAVVETAHVCRDTVSFSELAGMPEPPRARWGGV
jgi:hypothetical protein